MFKKFIVFFLGIFILSGCSDGFRSYFKRSANNKLVDRKGFDGSKRKPLYNSKYITLAKKNIMEDNLDDDDSDDDDIDDPLHGEKIDPIKRNREMYLKMIKKDIERYKVREAGEEAISLKNADRKLRKSNNNDKDEKLEKEIAQIKEMLKETRRDMSKYTCPNAQRYVPSTTNYESVKDNVDTYNKKSKGKQRFIREDDDSACAI